MHARLIAGFLAGTAVLAASTGGVQVKAATAATWCLGLGALGPCRAAP